MEMNLREMPKKLLKDVPKVSQVLSIRLQPNYPGKKMMVKIKRMVEKMMVKTKRMVVKTKVKEVKESLVET